MAFLEHGMFCSAEEYSRDKERRVLEGSLRINDIYSMAVRLDSTAREAAKLAIRLVDKKETILSCMILDSDLNPMFGFDHAMNDGLMAPNDLVVVDVEAGRREFSATQAFLKDYFDDQFDSILDKTIGLSLAQ